MAQAKKAAKKQSNTDKAVLAAEIGAGVLAAAGAAAAGYYFYADKDAVKHRRKTAKWAGEMKAKVAKEAKKQLKNAQKLDKVAIATIVDRASKTYDGVKNVRREDLMAAAGELKRNWKALEAEIAQPAKKAAKKKSAKKSTAKKAAPKKASKKAAKKS